MKMRNHDHIKDEKGENHIISQGKKLHNSTKSWLFFKKLGSFELGLGCKKLVLHVEFDPF